ncbi:hypothetical protein GGS26DRAFT_598933 [Hypomontagnella submonticulosa]|nr:hypothetical protein GGS26DRAFT_598933 [Hypomontagnella submonticulosa]
MYVSSVQMILTAGLALAGSLKKEPRIIVEGEVLDNTVNKCADNDGNRRCTKPFVLEKSTCYYLEWDTPGAIKHTNIEVRDSGSDELVYHRNTNGKWTPEKTESIYLDFIPKVPGTGGYFVHYIVRTCE